MASEHRLVLVSKLAPVTLSSSGALVSDAQPDNNQMAATRVVIFFMVCSVRWLNTILIVR